MKKPKVIKTDLEKIIDAFLKEKLTYYCETETLGKNVETGNCYGYYTEISGVNITSFNLNDFINNISKTKDKILKYCVDRILRNSNLNKDSLETRVFGGYYGDEYEISLNNEISNKIVKNLESLKNKNDFDMIKEVLLLEYGYLLESINNKTSCNIEKINIKDVILNDYYVKKVNDLECYGEDYKLERGIYIKEGSKFRIIDGYHRFMAAKKLNYNTINAIVLS